MGRKLFREKGITAAGKVLPVSDFVPVTGRGEGVPDGLFVQNAYKESLISDAEKLAGKKYTALLASDYMRFREDGDRITYENIYFERRQDLMTLFTAETVEGNGRFMKQIIDLVWMICDEATWVLPAHNLVKPDDTGALPYCIDAGYEDAVDYLDLFSASTGADRAPVVTHPGDPFAAYPNATPPRSLYTISVIQLTRIRKRSQHASGKNCHAEYSSRSLTAATIKRCSGSGSTARSITGARGSFQTF